MSTKISKRKFLIGGGGALTGLALGIFPAKAQERRDGPEFNHDTPKAKIPVDCDLAPDGRETEAFVRQYEIWDHTRPGTPLSEVKAHLDRTHGISQQTLDRGLEICETHFPRR